MGVKNLWDILESCKKVLPLSHLQNKRVCIDLSCWMVQLQNVNKSHSSMRDKLYLRGLFHRLRALIALNCSLIFVTDGSIPAIKLSAYRKRLNSGSDVTQSEPPAQALRRNMGSEFSCMIKEAKLLGMALGVPCLDGIEEAEAQCALLNSESLCDGCFSSDSDVFLFGAKTVYRDICLGEGGSVICYEMADIKRKLGFGRNSLITLALLLGSDYSLGLHGIGPESACHIVKSIGDSAVLQQIASVGLSFAKKTKNSKKKGKLDKCSDKEDSQEHEMNGHGSGNSVYSVNQLLQVVDAYLVPKCHSADSDAVQRVLAQYPFQRTELQQICAQFFDWPPQKTDEYILPKIAERDLRRFANLRLTSSDLGVKLSLNEIPVRCPVTEIIKHRKVHGEECFEVSWQGMYGLASSVVPADLLKSACPEKITEYEERKAQRKKKNTRKPRERHLQKGLSDAEINIKLQNLILDIESGSSAVSDVSSNLRTVMSKSQPVTIDIDIVHQDSVVGTEFKSRSTAGNASMTCFQSDCNKEVIDLLSPSPPRGNKIVRRYGQNNHQTIEVIDLSD